MGKQALFKSMFALFLASLVVACNLLPAAPLPDNAECVLAPGTPGPNLYDLETEDWVRQVYGHAQIAGPIPNNEFKGAQYAAFRILGQQTERWSGYVDLKVSDTNFVRITLTYLSPQLIEAVLLNNVLRKKEIGDPIDVFASRVKAGLDQVGNRNEMLFLMTITKSDPGLDATSAVNITIPLQNMILTNSSNQKFGPKRSDHIVDYSILLDKEPVSALISYQMTVGGSSECHLMLDPQSNNTISLHLEGVQINGVTREPLTWTIRFASLLGGGQPDIIPKYVDGAEIPEHWKPDSDAPHVLRDIPNTVSGLWDQYWEKMACYVWGQLTPPDSQ